jgi:hypothetical protein
MHRVESAGELNHLMSLPDDQLPEKARPTTGGFWAGREAKGKEKPLRAPCCCLNAG